MGEPSLGTTRHTAGHPYSEGEHSGTLAPRRAVIEPPCSVRSIPPEGLMVIPP